MSETGTFNPNINVLREEQTQNVAQLKDHDRQIATLTERDRTREKALEVISTEISTTLREIKKDIHDAISPIAEMVKTHAGTLINYDNRIVIATNEIATLKAENIALKAEVKLNTDARLELKTQLNTVAGLIKWLIALAPLIGIAVGVLTFFGLNHRL